MRVSFMVLLAAIYCPSVLGAADRDPPAIRIEVNNQSLEAVLLGQSDESAYLLGRDGSLCKFAAQDLRNARSAAAPFRGYSHSELRSELLREFGRRFDVSGTGHYLVVHPAGQRDLWAQRFEQLYRLFVQYTTTRGFRVSDPQFPLVAIVFHQREEFLKHAAAQGAQIGAGVVGYYSTKSNRIVLYDHAGGLADDAAWQQNAAAIVHEVTHQSAFNTGVHNRFAAQPRWLVEGLGMMFEAPGVWNSSGNPMQSQRVNHGRLAEFKDYAQLRRPQGSLAELVSSDRVFQSDPHGAYAEAWALSFYLAETQPQKYFQYMAKIGARQNFSAYRSPDRLQDFTEAFGDNWPMLEAQLQRFLAGLR